MKSFNKILIANRGEIAVRIIKAAKTLGVKTVTVYSDADSVSHHTLLSDESYHIGSDDLSNSYLNINKIIDIAKKTNCNAIHPGYGFLSENHRFVDACKKNDIVFIGPSRTAMDIMGNKINAREFVRKLNVPMTQSMEGGIDELMKAGNSIPFPLLIKAAAGGGGKGMRIVRNEKELRHSLEATSREALTYFGDATVYIEQFIENPRHIEVQIIGDNFGNVVHLFERECSIQRRYQKIIEESPSLTLNTEVRKKMCDTAVKIGKEIGYNNAGTIEFLVDSKMNYYFLEMNTRVQVEHPVTEMVTGIDIVREQILIAAGNQLSFIQNDIRQKGHAIECRVYAEDYENNFLPSPGRMIFYKEPELHSADYIRIDGAYKSMVNLPEFERESHFVHPFFDPMISKLIVWGNNRNEARIRMTEALKNYFIHGIKTNIPYLINFMNNEDYINNLISTKFCEEKSLNLLAECSLAKNKIQAETVVSAHLLYLANSSINKKDIWHKIGFWRDIMNISADVEGKELNILISSLKNNCCIFEIDGKSYSAHLKSIKENLITFEIDGHNYSACISISFSGTHFISIDGNVFSLKRNDFLIKEDVFSGSSSAHHHNENHVISPMPGKIIKINVKEGDNVKKGDHLIVVEAMKMENLLVSHKDAIISKINVRVGDMVDASTHLIHLND